MPAAVLAAAGMAAAGAASPAHTPPPSRAHACAVARVASVPIDTISSPPSCGLACAAASAPRLTRITHPLLYRPPVLGMAWQDGCTPLHCASQEGHAGAVDRLIAARADVESKTMVLHA